MEKKKIYIIILIIYLIIVFGSEMLYRNKVYDESVDIIEDIKQEGFFHRFSYFYSVIFLYGVIGIGFLISFLFYPITYSFCFLSVLFILTFIMSILKSLYSEQRPFWDIYLNNQGNSTEKILPDPTECDGEFGNPSGHSLLTSVFLILWHQFINSKYCKKLEPKKSTIIKCISLIISIICMASVAYSRINRQIHSINQVIFGLTLGFAVFFTFCYILELNIQSYEELIDNMQKYKFIVNIIFFTLFIISIILGLTRHNDKEDEYKKILKLYCDLSEEESFAKITLYTSILIFIVIGGYFGLLFLDNKISKNHLNDRDQFFNWNKNGKLTTLQIFFLTFLSIFFFIINFFIPFKYYALKMIISLITYFLFGFFFFGVCFYYGCILFIIRKKEKIDEISLLRNDENEKNDD